MKVLKLRTQHMPTKVSKPPKKGKGSKYNRQQNKQWKKDVGESKLKQLAEHVLKVKRIYRLLEVLMREEHALGGWNQYFVIGPDSKLLRVHGDDKFPYHGSAMKNYPSIWNDALLKFGGEDNLEQEIRDGSRDVYEFMYQHKFIRGGPGWVSFNPRTAPSKSLMLVLQLAKESSKTKFDVEDMATKHYIGGMSLEDFIEKYL